jgi:toxin ParE1/3/4
LRIVWFRSAIVDLEEARAYIANDDPRAARRVASAIVGAVDRLAAHPAAGRPGRVPGTRELIVSRTPYVIPYRVREGVIEILRVFHARRRWPDRL